MSADAADDQPQKLATLGLEEAAAALRMAPSTLRKRARAGKVPGYRPGRQWVFLSAEIEAYLRASAPLCACRSIDVKKLRVDPRWTMERAGSDLARELEAKLRSLKRERSEQPLSRMRPRKHG
jgi:excisionase family DNA binding protein